MLVAAAAVEPSVRHATRPGLRSTPRRRARPASRSNPQHARRAPDRRARVLRGRPAACLPACLRCAVLPSPGSLSQGALCCSQRCCRCCCCCRRPGPKNTAGQGRRIAVQSLASQPWSQRSGSSGGGCARPAHARAVHAAHVFPSGCPSRCQCARQPVLPGAPRLGPRSQALCAARGAPMPSSTCSRTFAKSLSEHSLFCPTTRTRPLARNAADLHGASASWWHPWQNPHPCCQFHSARPSLVASGFVSRRAKLALFGGRLHRARSAARLGIDGLNSSAAHTIVVLPSAAHSMTTALR